MTADDVTSIDATSIPSETILAVADAHGIESRPDWLGHQRVGQRAGLHGTAREGGDGVA